MKDVYSKLVEEQGFSAAQRKILEIIGENKKVLEIGSSYGYLTWELKKNHCLVDIVENNRDAFLSAKKAAQKAFFGSIEDSMILDGIDDKYDFVILADVLEHLANPRIPLKKSTSWLKNGGKVIISIPNIASWPARKELFFNGKFEYQQSGLFDKTHLRFYSLNAFKKLLSQSGLTNESIIPAEVYLPFKRTLVKLPFIKYFFSYFYQLIAEKFPNLAYYHYVLIAAKK